MSSGLTHRVGGISYVKALSPLEASCDIFDLCPENIKNTEKRPLAQLKQHEILCWLPVGSDSSDRKCICVQTLPLLKAPIAIRPCDIDDCVSKHIKAPTLFVSLPLWLTDAISAIVHWRCPHVAATTCLLRLRHADTIWTIDQPDPTADMISDL